jgi:hypothetical protein
MRRLNQIQAPLLQNVTPSNATHNVPNPRGPTLHPQRVAVDSEPEEGTKSARLVEDHLQLMFELRSELVDKKFRIELLDRKVYLLLDLWSSQQ